MYSPCTMYKVPGDIAVIKIQTASSIAAWMYSSNFWIQLHIVFLFMLSSNQNHKISITHLIILIYYQDIADGETTVLWGRLKVKILLLFHEFKMKETGYSCFTKDIFSYDYIHFHIWRISYNWYLLKCFMLLNFLFTLIWHKIKAKMVKYLNNWMQPLSQHS